MVSPALRKIHGGNRPVALISGTKIAVVIVLVKCLHLLSWLATALNVSLRRACSIGLLESCMVRTILTPAITLQSSVVE